LNREPLAGTLWALSKPTSRVPSGACSVNRVRQAVRTLFGRFDALDLALDPVALFEMMDASIESKQEFESVFGSSGLTYHVRA